MKKILFCDNIFSMNTESKQPPLLCKRFRGFLPIVIDVETGGVDPNNNPLLEIAMVQLNFDENQMFSPGETHHWHIKPFEGAKLDPKALQINKIVPDHPFRFAIDEKKALQEMFDLIKAEIKKHQCQRAVLVGHNAWFDLAFIMAAAKRCGFKKTPFHSFTTFDTATLAGAVYGETVLAKAMKAASMEFDQNQAHSAIYDTEKTADLFCHIINNLNSK